MRRSHQAAEETLFVELPPSILACHHAHAAATCLSDISRKPCTPLTETCLTCPPRTWKVSGRMFSLMFLRVCAVSLFVTLNTVNAFTPTLMRVTQQRTSRTSFLTMAKSDEMTDEEHQVAMDKATKAMTAFTNKYLENTDTFLCSDSSVPAVVIKGLAEHKVTLGAPLCPCRFYDDKEKEVKDGYWNCPWYVATPEKQVVHSSI